MWSADKQRGAMPNKAFNPTALPSLRQGSGINHSLVLYDGKGIGAHTGLL
jgi:hypothetical protein